MAELNAIRLRGVRQNNLKGIDLDLPIGDLIVVTGLSGAGKSSLVFDALHAEGNRRYAETFSPYTRQFMELLDRPKVDSIENIRPSIAIEQGNTVKTSRSTVGTMTELCDYFKVWFANCAQLHDPETGEVITTDTPQTIWKKSLQQFRNENVLLTFAVHRPGKLDWSTILNSVSGQGYTRGILNQKLVRLDELKPETLAPEDELHVVQDRVSIKPASRGRFIESAQTALHFGDGQMSLFNTKAKLLHVFSEGLHRPGSTRRFRAASPNLFSFNSPIGACPLCRGFGRVIEIDDGLVIPDHKLSLEDGAIKAFSGAVYSESQRDLLKACKRFKIPTKTPWKKLAKKHRDFVLYGEPGYGSDGSKWPKGWYGVRRFFKWLEENTYKMHVRVFLSRYRSYVKCPDCEGTRLQPESLCWKWKGFTLPDLYEVPVSELVSQMGKSTSLPDEPQADLARQAIQTRLSYLEAVGLGYLTLNRSSRSLSGGETQRVNLTSCLGTSLVDTLFILDEPSIGLHCRDIDRLIKILRKLTDMGNTVVVVEHDEGIMQAADTIIEVGPAPGKNGGEIVYAGRPNGLKRLRKSPTGQFLSGRRLIKPPKERRPVTKDTPFVRMRGVQKHNLNGLNVDIPLRRFVVLSGVSGSGKSTLLHNGLYQGLLSRSGKACEDPARIEELSSELGFGEILLVDQSPASKTPRSNPALFVGAWDGIRQVYARTEDSRRAGLTPSAFSFNSGDGRCPHCQGLGFERVEMQFMADVYVPCPVCEGKQFRDEILALQWNGRSIADILALTIDEAIEVFEEHKPIVRKLRALEEVGLGYLPLGQPLNTLSGGESQRLKLVRYMGSLSNEKNPALLLLDEPTTGLHKADIERLLGVLQQLVDNGHSLVVIEHHPDVIRAADWLLELGPEAGSAGGKLVFAGTPDSIGKNATATAPYVLEDSPSKTAYTTPKRKRASGKSRATSTLQLTGAREHNLKNISVSIPRGAMSVVTGVSGSGKSTLAFDIIFAEGQRRFMESMSSWARQYVEQLPKPDIDHLSGISPTVAIEQRVTRGTRKSTVATITEVAQYLRLLYARIGIQHSPTTGEPLVALPAKALVAHLERQLKGLAKRRGVQQAHLLSPLIRGRKGHHEPLANWARDRGYSRLRIDGKWVPLDEFKKLDRYREHNVDLVTGSITFKNSRIDKITTKQDKPISLPELVSLAIDLGKGSCYLATEKAPEPVWFSTRRSDPVTGEAFPDLDPKDFSWNAQRGWCPTCRGHGALYSWMEEDERFDEIEHSFDDGESCQDCQGERLNPVSRSVYLKTVTGNRYNLPQLLKLNPGTLLGEMDSLELDSRARAILAEILPEIRERLNFMEEVGLQYLSLDRPTNTLSGGEAQRIRLAAQLGSNLAGALYVLDEPSIGLHERDNQRLLDSLEGLKAKGNTLLVVEHDAHTMRQADHIIDLGPGAGKNGGHILAEGSLNKLLKNRKSLTGQYLRKGIPHPLRGQWRDLPESFNPRRRSSPDDWLVLRKASLRNLKGDDVFIPKQRLTMVCGISGAGKSTLVRDLLMPNAQRAIREENKKLSGSISRDGFTTLIGAHTFRQVIEVDQSPIGKTPRSTPATYIGAFDRIREFFAATPEARMHGYQKGTFSFNTKGGRCETCKGAGRIKLEMNFMPDTYVPCEDCNSRRYGNELEEIRWKDASIADVLEMTFEEAARFFEFDSQLGAILKLMVETGLGYLTLGQSSPTLSGGEAQRLKLVSELARGLPTFQERKSAIFQPNLYILEEPTIGLHLHDCERLIHLLHRLVDQGHTVIVIEHHLDLIAEADYLLEIGPDGGDAGGQILYQGPVEGLKRIINSPTRPFLQEIIG
ncbi:excinuclease ABC subunit UvrA [Puniceicoccales bacterium CK1056]|uniref:UvrABC system protein A n=1 Tax=Oceanipulchritudo coccoides TaxID=2706888 RepID=A0A6B2M444_9BACT|nr:excinuclease ABC subunit UvrA [Oceanipulchritudo coccoides]NDV63116.1 excinuclease ABC subunit UvrA [Oceanipulchritudo coccoides]